LLNIGYLQYKLCNYKAAMKDLIKLFLYFQTMKHFVSGMLKLALKDCAGASDAITTTLLWFKTQHFVRAFSA